MAQKNNKQRQARKQHKQQRRKARTSRRDAGRSKLRPTPLPFDTDMITDMGFLPQAPGNMVFPGPGMEELLFSIVASEDLANEPELKSILINPVQCVNTYAEVGEEMGYTPQTLADLPEEDHEEVQMQILETSVQRVLTRALQQEIRAGLKALRARWQKEGKPEAAARVAALQSFLDEEKGNSAWAMLGVVQAIFHRSMMIGFELFEATAATFDTDGTTEESTSLYERLSQPDATQKIAALLQEHPEVRDFMEGEADRTWDEGQEAIYSGELDLGLFTEEELREGLELLAELLGYDETTGKLTKGISPASKEARNVVSRVEDYVADRLTPQRLVQMQERLALVLKEKTLEQKWFPFILLLAEDMKTEDAIENQRGLLVRTFFGEMRKLSQAPGEDDDHPDEDAES
jgi:hypothetical protein